MFVWQLDGDTARLALTRMSALVTPGDPSGGLQAIAADNQPLATQRWMQVCLPDSPLAAPLDNVDCYVRSADLIATYPERGPSMLGAQIYWRASCDPANGVLAAIELLVSVQTSRLDSFPTLAVRSESVASEVYRLQDADRGTFASLVPKPDHSEVGEQSDLPSCFLFRLPGGRYSYAEMVHPTDARESDWEGWLSGQDLRLRVEHRLFSQPLEKGVILKARLVGVLMERVNDRHQAMQAWHKLLNQKLPLTA